MGRAPRRFRQISAACALVAILLTPIAARACDPLDALVAAYPAQLAGHTDTALIWRDGIRTPVGPTGGGIEHASVGDQMAEVYPGGDAGRARDRAFFTRM